MAGALGRAGRQPVVMMCDVRFGLAAFTWWLAAIHYIMTMWSFLWECDEERYRR